MGQESLINRERDFPAHLEDLKVEDTGLRLRGDLLRQCQVLLNELEEFEQYLVKQKKDNGVELRHFKNNVRTEAKSLEKVCNSRDVNHREQTFTLPAKSKFVCEQSSLSRQSSITRSSMLTAP